MLGLPLSLFVFVRFLMTPLLPSSTYVLFEWPLIYFQWKEAIKVQIGWNFTWAVGSLKFCTLVGSFCKSYKVSTKKIQKTYHSWHWRMMQNLKKTGLRFQMRHEEFDEFSPNHSKVQKCSFDALFLSKIYEVWAKKIQRSYLSWHATVMQSLNKSWPCGFKNSMRNWVNFH